MNMKYIVIACCILSLTGCSGRRTEAPVAKPVASKEPTIRERFVSLLLSDTPLRYQDAHSFFSWLDDDARLSETDLNWLDDKTRLSETDKETVCALLRQFLSRKTARQVDPAQGMTGLAPPEAILRAYAVRLLAKFGGEQDMEFIQELSRLDPESLPPALRYPSWRTICEDALTERKRDRQE
jgi:hypothetical protein